MPVTTGLGQFCESYGVFGRALKAMSNGLPVQGADRCRSVTCSTSGPTESESATDAPANRSCRTTSRQSAIRGRLRGRPARSRRVDPRTRSFAPQCWFQWRAPASARTLAETPRTTWQATPRAAASSPRAAARSDRCRSQLRAPRRWCPRWQRSPTTCPRAARRTRRRSPVLSHTCRRRAACSAIVTVRIPIPRGCGDGASGGGSGPAWRARLRRDQQRRAGDQLPIRRDSIGGGELIDAQAVRGRDRREGLARGDDVWVIGRRNGGGGQHHDGREGKKNSHAHGAQFSHRPPSGANAAILLSACKTAFTRLAVECGRAGAWAS